MTADLRGLLGHTHFVSAADAELLARYVVERDDLAFAELVQRHAPAVYAACRRFVSASADLDDAFQAVFVLLSRKAGAISDPTRLSGWLRGAAGRIARKVRDRSTRNAGTPLEGVPEPAAAEADPTDLKAVLDEELARLPAAYREVVLLCDVDGLARRPAAKRLGIPESTLSNRLTRARAMLGTRLLRRGVALGAGLSLSAVATAAVPGKLVPLTVSRITADAVSPDLLTLANSGVPPMLPLKTASLFLAGLLLAGFALVPFAAADHLQAKGPVPGKKPADPPEPEDPKPEEIEGYHQVSASAYSRDGKRLAIVRSDTKQVVVYDAATWKVLHTLDGLKGLGFAVRFSADGRTLYAAGYDGPILTWDAATGKAGGTLDAKAGRCFGLVLSPDGKRLASAHDDPQNGKSSIRLWDTATGKVERVLACDEYLLANTVTFTPDGQTVAGGYHATHKKTPDADGFHGVIEWDVATGKEAKRFDTPRVTAGAHPVAHAIAFTKDGKRLILGGGEAVPIPGGKGSTMLYGYLWLIDRKTGEVEKTLIGNRDDYIRTLAVSPDGQRLYVPAGALAARARPGVNPNAVQPVYELQCWDTATWELSWSKASRTPWDVHQFAVAPDGKRVGGSGTSGFHLFDAETGEAKGGLVTIVRPR